jgi:hypothetical protein
MSAKSTAKISRWADIVDSDDDDNNKDDDTYPKSGTVIVPISDSGFFLGPF